MIEFGYILIIIFELIITSLIVWGLIYLEDKARNCLEAVNIEAKGTLEKLKDVNLKLKNFNQGFSTVKKINCGKIKDTILLVLDIINFIMLVRSMDFRRGKALNFKNIKKLVPFSFVKKFLNLFKNNV